VNRVHRPKEELLMLGRKEAPQPAAPAPSNGHHDVYLIEETRGGQQIRQR
jgi:hypothetical protein